MTEMTLLRPDGLVRSPAFSHVAVVPPGATTIRVGGQNAVDGAAPTVVVLRVAGLAVPGALVEVSAIAAVTP
jgi:hypothetical protein